MVQNMARPEKKVKSVVPEVKDSITCPKCQKGEVVKGKQAWGCTAFRDGCDFRLPFEFAGKRLSDTVIKAICRKGRSGEIKSGGTDEIAKSGFVVLGSDFTLSFESKVAEPLLCPRCKRGLIIKGKAAWGCAEFRNGCALRIPFIFLGKALSDNTMEQLILKGKTGKITGFTGDDGSKRDGRLYFDKEFRINLE